MPTIKGGFSIKGGKIIKGDLSTELPFLATGWKSEKNFDRVEGGKPLLAKDPIRVEKEESSMDGNAFNYDEAKDLKKEEQIILLEKRGLSKKEIRKLKYEDERILKILDTNPSTLEDI